MAQTKNYVLQDEMIDRMADTIVELQKEESAALPLLRQQLKQANSAIDNMLKAIEQGILTSSTKRRLEELEERKEELGIAIAREQIQRTFLTKEEIVFFIRKSHEGDIDDVEYRKRLVDTFINAIYLYDDKITLLFNYNDGTKTITLRIYRVRILNI